MTNDKPSLSHVGDDGRPRMVDISEKAVSDRSAIAESAVVFPADMAAALRGSDMRAKKGPVIDTAIIAGTMAVKRCHELIPFCHPLPIDGCKFDIDWRDERTLGIRCQVRTRHTTGIEMEALTGASVAALTIYDMCKALGQGMAIGPTRLLQKHGGRHDYDAGTAEAGDAD